MNNTILISQELANLPGAILGAILVATYYLCYVTEYNIVEFVTNNEMLVLINQLNTISQEVLDNHNNLNSNLSIQLYESLVYIHTEVERLFHLTQNIVGMMEALSDGDNIDPDYNMYSNFGERIREEGNSLVTALRSLENNISNESPYFQFLEIQWFE